MNELKRRKTENGIDYVLIGDYYIPDLKLPEENCPIGKFGRLHQEFQKEKYPARYSELMLSCELQSYLVDMNEQAQGRLDTIIAQMKVAEGVTEEMKANDQMEWVRRCNSIRN